MQAKKRAKPIKFGRKQEQPHSAVEQTPLISGNGGHESTQPVENQEQKAAASVNQTHAPSEKAEEQNVEVIIESETEKTEITVTQPENNQEQNVLEKHTEPPSAEQVNQTADQGQDLGENPQNQYIQNSSETTEAQSEQVITDEPEQPSDNPLQSLGGDTYIVEKKVHKNVLGYFILIAIISFAVGLISMAGANYFLKDTNMHVGIPFLSGNITSTPTVVPSIEPTATPEVVNLAEYKIKILNGSGITGIATKLKTSLINAGFDVAAIGNADNNNYTDTIISAGKDIKSSYLAKLKDELGKSFVISTETSSSSAAGSDADLVVTLGTKTVSQK